MYMYMEEFWAVTLRDFKSAVSFHEITNTKKQTNKS